MRVLIAGGAGFLGSHLAHRLVAGGADVEVVDDLSTGSLTRLRAARTAGAGRLAVHTMHLPAPELAELMARRPPDVVVHLAVGDRRPLGPEEAATEVTLAVCLLEAATDAGVGRVVLGLDASACYGALDPVDLPAAERGVRRPDTPAGVADGAILSWLEWYRSARGLEHCALLIGEVFGAGGDGTVGPGLVGALMQAAPDRPVVAHPDDLVDLVHIDEVTDAIARALDRGGGLTLNVGTGTGVPVRRIAEWLGVPRGALETPDRPARRVVLDPSRAALYLRWRPWVDPAVAVPALVAG